MMMKYFYLFLFFLSFILTGWARWVALKIGCIDHPNQRSAHAIPTPRGGGIAFVLCFIGSLLFFIYQQLIPMPWAYSLMCIGIATACLGYYDDRYHLSAGLRLVVQLIIVSLALYLLHAFEWTSFVFFKLGMILFVVWFINLFNFMDGIDGYAAMEAIFMAISFALLYGSWIAVVMLTLSVSVLGFMFWNFPKAKIFMGDVGSGFLGGIFAISMIFFSHETPIYFCGSMILVALFFLDSSLTLIKRLWRFEVIWQPHQQHAYQRLTHRWQSHCAVTLFGFMVNVLWLFPLAYLTIFLYIPVWLGVGLAYSGVMILMTKINQAVFE